MFSIARNQSKKVLNTFSIARNQIRKVSDVPKKGSSMPDTLSVSIYIFAGVGMAVGGIHEELHCREHDNMELMPAILNCLIGGNIGAACGFVVWTAPQILIPICASSAIVGTYFYRYNKMSTAESDNENH